MEKIKFSFIAIMNKKISNNNYFFAKSNGVVYIILL